MLGTLFRCAGQRKDVPFSVKLFVMDRSKILQRGAVWTCSVVRGHSYDLAAG